MRWLQLREHSIFCVIPNTPFGIPVILSKNPLSGLKRSQNEGKTETETQKA